MRFIKRFCFCYSVSTGVQVIGYLNSLQILVTLVLSNATGMWWGNVLIIFPIINFFVFYRMLHNDTVQWRKHFYLWQLTSYIIQDFLFAGVVAVQRYTVVVKKRPEDRCMDEVCFYGKMP